MKANLISFTSIFIVVKSLCLFTIAHASTTTSDGDAFKDAEQSFLVGPEYLSLNCEDSPQCRECLSKASEQDNIRSKLKPHLKTYASLKGATNTIGNLSGLSYQQKGLTTSAQGNASTGALATGQQSAAANEAKTIAMDFAKELNQSCSGVDPSLAKKYESYAKTAENLAQSKGANSQILGDMNNKTAANAQNLGTVEVAASNLDTIRKLQKSYPAEDFGTGTIVFTTPNGLITVPNGPGTAFKEFK